MKEMYDQNVSGQFTNMTYSGNYLPRIDAESGFNLHDAVLKANARTKKWIAYSVVVGSIAVLTLAGIMVGLYLSGSLKQEPELPVVQENGLAGRGDALIGGSMAGGAGKKKLDGSIHGLGGAVPTTPKPVQNNIDPILMIAATDNDVIDNVQDAVSDVADNVNDVVSDVAETATDLAGDAIDTAGDLFDGFDMFDDLTDNVGDMFDGIGDNADIFGDNLDSGFEDLLENMGDQMEDALDVLGEPNDMMEDFTDNVEDLVEDLTDIDDIDDLFDNDSENDDNDDSNDTDDDDRSDENDDDDNDDDDDDDDDDRDDDDDDDDDSDDDDDDDNETDDGEDSDDFDDDDEQDNDDDDSERDDSSEDLDDFLDDMSDMLFDEGILSDDVETESGDREETTDNDDADFFDDSKFLSERFEFSNTENEDDGDSSFFGDSDVSDGIENMASEFMDSELPNLENMDSFDIGERFNFDSPLSDLDVKEAVKDTAEQVRDVANLDGFGFGDLNFNMDFNPLSHVGDFVSDISRTFEDRPAPDLSVPEFSLDSSILFQNNDNIENRWLTDRGDSMFSEESSDFDSDFFSSDSSFDSSEEF